MMNHYNFMAIIGSVDVAFFIILGPQQPSKLIFFYKYFQMSIEKFQRVLEKHIESIKLEQILLKIARHEHFEPKLIQLVTLEKKVIFDIMEYLVLREHLSCCENETEIQLLKKQEKLRINLQNVNLDHGKKLHDQSKVFIEKIVLLSLVIQAIASSLNHKTIKSLDPRQSFIVLIFLSSGKLVSIKSYDLAKQKMKKKSHSFVQLPTATTINSIKSTKRVQESGNKDSELKIFMQEVRKALYGDQPFRSKKSSKSRYLLRKKGAQAQGKVLFEQRKEVYPNLKEASKFGTEQSVQPRKEGKSIYRKPRVSLDRNLSKNYLKVNMNDSDKNRTQIIKYRKLSKVDSTSKTQLVIRTLSIVGSKNRVAFQS